VISRVSLREGMAASGRDIHGDRPVLRSRASVAAMVFPNRSWMEASG
jgi:hypothetical protein